MARLMPGMMRCLAAVLVLTCLALVPQAVFAQTSQTGSSGLPVPRFVSLKSDRVNIRIGPTREHAVGWTYVQAGLPVEIIQEFENWRRIRDWEGKEGWVYHSLLSGRRTALVTPWEADAATPIRATPKSDGVVVAELKSRVLATVDKCDDGWCRIHGKGYDGWIDQTRLFGVYPNETID